MELIIPTKQSEQSNGSYLFLYIGKYIGITGLSGLLGFILTEFTTTTIPKVEAAGKDLWEVLPEA